MSPKRSSRKSSIKLSPENRERIAATALEHPISAPNDFYPSSRRGGRSNRGTGPQCSQGTGSSNAGTTPQAPGRTPSQPVLTLSEEQHRALQEFNPCLRERHLECHPPGLILIQDAVDFGNLKNIGWTFLHATIDSSCCLAFAALAGSPDPAAAVAVLKDQTLAFFRQEGIAVQTIMAGRGLVSGGGADPGYENFLKSQGISSLCRRPAISR